MAEYNLAQTGNLTPEDYAQQQQLNRQQQMAQMLMQQSAQPQGQMISGRYVAPSWAQSLVPLANIAASQYIGNKADTEAAKLAQKIREAKGAKEQAITSLITGTPDQTTEMAGPYTGKVPMPVAVKEGTKPDLAAALREISTNNPYEAGKDYKAAILSNMIPKTPDSVLKYKFAQTPEGGNFKGTINEFENQMNDYQKEQLAIDKQKLGIEFQKLQNELGGAKLTDSQGNATAYGLRAKQANQIASGLENQGVTNTGLIRSTVGGIVGGTPFIGKNLENTTDTLLNFTASDAQQKTKQARQNFITAVLRKESGATISPEEFQVEEEKYFPKINDSKETIKQKQEARELAIKALEIQAGPGAKFIRESGQTPSENTSGWSLKK